MRCFISIELVEEAKKGIIKVQSELQKKKLFSGKLTEPENLHLTLKFLGEIEDERVDEIAGRLREIKFKKFKAELKECGVFSENFVRIIWVHLAGCEELQKEIDRKLTGLFQKEARFMGHITIARVKSVKDKKALLDELKKIKLSGEFFAEKFSLMKSTLTEKGPIYETIEDFSLD